MFSNHTAHGWERGIRSNCTLGGFMEITMSGFLFGYQRQNIDRRTGLKKVPHLESLAVTEVYLLGDSTASVTGRNVFVDLGTA